MVKSGPQTPAALHDSRREDEEAGAAAAAAADAMAAAAAAAEAAIAEAGGTHGSAGGENSVFCKQCGQWVPMSELDSHEMLHEVRWSHLVRTQRHC